MKRPADWGTLVEKECPVCNKMFKVPYSKRELKHCSYMCSAKTRNWGKKVSKECPVCKQTFIVANCKKGKKYCSFSCSVKGRNYSTWHKDEVRNCPVCKTEFSVKYWSKKRYCSFKCSTIGSRGRPNGRRALEKQKRPSSRRYTMVDGRKMLIHRFVKEMELGRQLSSLEVVHHIDLDCENIDPVNLALFETEQLHQIAHRSIDKLILPLLKMGFILFSGSEYVLTDAAATFRDLHPGV